MAVPPTHDGSVGPRSTSGSTVVTVLTAVFAVVSVVCVVVLGMRYSDASGSFANRASEVFGGGGASSQDPSADDTRARELVLSQANQFMLRINTYGPSDLDKQNKMPGYVSRVKEVITPKLDVDFEKSVTYAEQSVAEAGLARTITLYASGAESIDNDVATVLVTGAISQSYPDTTKDKGRVEFEPQQFRYEVQLVKVDGTWLVDAFTPVRGDVAGEPTDGVPTDQPTDPATVDPSGSTTSPVVTSYAQVIANRRPAIDDAVAALDTCGFPRAVDPAADGCPDAPGALGAAAGSLANSLRGAANPDSKVFLGTPPQAIAALVPATQSAAANVVSSVAALRPACVVTASPACSTQRTTVTAAVTNLLTALGTWESIS